MTKTFVIPFFRFEAIIEEAKKSPDWVFSGPSQGSTER